MYAAPATPGTPSAATFVIYLKPLQVPAIGQVRVDVRGGDGVCSGVEEETGGLAVVLVIHVLRLDVVTRCGVVTKLQEPTDGDIQLIINIIELIV